MKPDHYQLHRLALLPLLPGASRNDLLTSAGAIDSVGQEKLEAFLFSQGLASMWHKKIVDLKLSSEFPPEFVARLQRMRLHSSGHYLMQLNTLKSLREALETAGIVHAVIKGAHIRELLYGEPALRPAVDIDLLIKMQDRVAAIRALTEQGYQLKLSADTVSHEVTLLKGDRSIDLHWDILRPGRTRIPMATNLLETRRDYGTHWGMCDEANLFLMLVHPVFTKYGTAPQASLMRLVDLAHWINRRDINWEQLLLWLRDTGCCTAAWTSLEWLALLTQCAAPAPFVEEICPGKIRQAYLKYWVSNNLSTALLSKPTLIKAGFTLPVHDRITDAVHALKQAQKEKRCSGESILHLKSLFESNLTPCLSIDQLDQRRQGVPPGSAANPEYDENLETDI